MERAGPRLILSKFDGPGRAAPHEMWTVYRPHRPAHEGPICFDGPTGTATIEMWCTASAPTSTTSTVPKRPGHPRGLTGQPGPWPMPCGVILPQLRLLGECLGRYPPKPATFEEPMSGKSTRV